jgi:hypothetical protein
MKKIVLVFLGGLVFGEGKPIPELDRMKFVAAYQAAIIDQQNVQAAQAAFQGSQEKLTKDLAAYHALETSEAKALGYPEGTTFTTDVNKQEVTAVVPKEDKK